MMCPVKLASEVSALSGEVRGSMTQCGHEVSERSRSGAGDETPRRDVTSDGQEDYVLSGGPRSQDQLPADAALEDAIHIPTF
jgi:hypothetical protein